MYSGYGATSPPLTNNPFISGGNPTDRFPDLSTPPQPQQQYGSWGGGMAGGYPQQQQQNTYQQQQQQQQSYPQQQQMGYAQPQQQMGMALGPSGNSGYLSPQQAYPTQGNTATFQPSSSFGQQLAAQVSGSSYGYLQGQQQQQQQQNSTAYNPAQQQLQNNPGYIAQFDPYSSLGQVLGSGGNIHMSPNVPQNQVHYGNGTAQSLSTGSTMSSASGSGSSGWGTSPTGVLHPKDHIRIHKTEIEAWDQNSWKQLISTFESLMQAWEGRKNELSRRVGELSQQMQAGMMYGQQYVMQIQQEGSRIQGLLKEAENNFDSVAASTFQMREVFEGYRQSSDMAGKRRVKEATNAALHGLPGWPQPY